MRSASQAKPRSPRVERRRKADRERILQSAAQLFAGSSPEHVRLEEIAEAADVARGTLYSHFESKEALLGELMRPVLEDALVQLEAVDRERSARKQVTALLHLYVRLWAQHSEALRLGHRLMMIGDRSGAMRTHLVFVSRVVALFEKADRAGILRAPTGELAGRTIARVAVPLLELYSPLPKGDALFVEAASALLLKK